MPQIIQEDKQLQALNRLEKMLENIRVLNTIIDSGNFALAAKDSAGRQCAQIEFAPDSQGKTKEKMLALITTWRDSLSSNARALASKNRIVFSDEEEAILSGELGIALSKKRGRKSDDKSASNAGNNAAAAVEDPEPSAQSHADAEDLGDDLGDWNEGFSEDIISVGSSSNTAVSTPVESEKEF